MITQKIETNKQSFNYRPNIHRVSVDYQSVPSNFWKAPYSSETLKELDEFIRQIPPEEEGS